MKDEQRRLAGVGLELGLALAVLWPFVEWSVPDPAGVRPVRLVAGLGTLVGGPCTSPSRPVSPWPRPTPWGSSTGT